MHTHLLQRVDLLILPVFQGLALGQQRLPFLFHPHHFVLQSAPFVVQVPDCSFLGHLSGLQAADLAYDRTQSRDVREMQWPDHHIGDMLIRYEVITTSLALILLSLQFWKSAAAEKPD